MNNRLTKFFTFAHLPEYLQAISKPCADLAELMNRSLPDSVEKTAGFRKLLEAKDCFVRARLEQLANEAAIMERVKDAMQ